MGTGNRFNPAKLEITDISKTYNLDLNYPNNNTPH